MPPRRLSFAVSTSLLTASLATGVAGCKDGETTVNPGPDAHEELPANPDPEPEGPPANPGPVEEPGEPSAEPDAEPEEMPEPADEPHVNTRPTEPGE